MSAAVTVQQNGINTKEVFVKNLFSLLNSRGDASIFNRDSFAHTVRELGLNRQQLNVWFSTWKEEPGSFYHMPSENENINLVFYLLSALIEDKIISTTDLEKMEEFAQERNINPAAVQNVIQYRKRFLSEKSILKRAGLIKNSLNGKAAGSAGKSTPAASENKIDFYIANQVTYEGLDEIQRMLLAHKLKSHVAIDGPPGVGKTRSVIEIASITGLNLHTKTCSSRTSESHIIAYPVLTIREGVSVTDQVSGPLARAMEEGSIFYGDEFNLLKEDVQKRLNSAFDERRYIDRTDGVQVKARPGFWAVISYNPTQNLISRDLEESVADRFVHLNYRRWNSDFKAYISSSRAKGVSSPGLTEKNDYGISLEWRGIGTDLKFMRGKRENGTLKWYNFFSGQPLSEDPVFKYLVNDRSSVLRKIDLDGSNSLEILSSQAFSARELARMLARFTDLLYALSQTGESPLLKKIGLSDLGEKEDLELLNIHESSARIETVALKHYHELLQMGCNRYLAQSYAVRLVIDQVCYGQYRERKLRDANVYDIVEVIARSMRLFASDKNYNTRMISENLLK